MTEATIIGLDLAKNVFQAHGAQANGSVALTPRQHSSGGKERLEKISKMGQRDAHQDRPRQH